MVEISVQRIQRQLRLPIEDIGAIVTELNNRSSVQLVDTDPFVERDDFAYIFLSRLNDGRDIKIQVSLRVLKDAVAMSAYSKQAGYIYTAPVQPKPETLRAHVERVFAVAEKYVPSYETHFTQIEGGC